MASWSPRATRAIHHPPGSGAHRRIEAGFHDIMRCGGCGACGKASAREVGATALTAVPVLGAHGAEVL